MSARSQVIALTVLFVASAFASMGSAVALPVAEEAVSATLAGSSTAASNSSVDTTGPSISNVTLDASAIDIGGSFNVTFTATDESSMVQFYAGFNRDGGGNSNVYANICCGPYANGTQTLAFQTDANTLPGNYTLSYLYGQDAHNNYASVSWEVAQQVHITIGDPNAPVDTTGPSISGVSVDATAIDIGGSFNLTFTATDESSMAQFYAGFNRDGGGNSNVYAGLCCGPYANGTQTLTFQTDANTLPGNYTLGYLYGQDAHNNYASVPWEDAQQIHITIGDPNTPVDVSGPSISNVTLDAAHADLGDSFNLTFTATDESSMLQFYGGFYRDGGGNSNVYGGICCGPYDNGTQTITFETSANTTPGNYTLGYLYGQDAHNNYAGLNWEDAQNIHITIGDASDNDGDGSPWFDDCNDGDASIHPGAYDTPGDGIDQDCNGSDATLQDNDGDGWDPSSDCNDWDSSIHPGAYDTPNDGIDQDCDGADAWAPQDRDGDGWNETSDCNDYDWNVHPGAYDHPGDGVDQDCDGVDAQVQDNDGDGYGSDVDCNDNDWSIHPGAFDRAYDGIDQDCDGSDTHISYLRAYAYAYSGGVWDTAEFGVQDGATDGFDQGLDAPQPPASPDADHLEAYFSYPENAPEHQKLSTSLIGGAATMTWDLHVQWENPQPSCGGCGANIQYYVPLDQIPAQFSLYLVDGSNVIDLRASENASCSCWQMMQMDETPSGSKDLTFVITTEGLHNIYLNPGWSLVSIPVTLHGDTSPSHVFGSAVDSVLTWDGSQYVDATTVQPGVGYWVHNTGDWTQLRLFGPAVHGFDTTLHHGWNLVGSPAGWAPTWTLPSTVSQTAFFWSWGGYGWCSCLFEGYGFWVYNDGNDVDAHIQGYATPIQNPAAGLVDALTPKTADDAAAARFVLPFQATDKATGSFANATLQATNDARDGFDATDAVMAPSPAVASWTQAGFHAGDMTLAKDAVAPVTRGVFALDVTHKGTAPSVQTLSWSSAQLPRGYTFELVDGLTRIDMRDASSYSWDVAAGLSTKSLAVVVRPTDAPTCVAELDGSCLAELPFDPRAIVGELLA